jgi:PPOX class probable F420-dependent enzyme
VPTGSCAALTDLPERARAIIEGARRAVLSTVDRNARPHSVPVCFAVRRDELISPIDHKPKSGGVLARVRNLEANPNATLLFDHWDEDWTRLGWVMVTGTAHMEQPPRASELLLDRYEQFRAMPDFDALIVIGPQRIVWWTWTD